MSIEDRLQKPGPNESSALFLLNLDTWITKESLVWLRDTQTPVYIVHQEVTGRSDIDEIVPRLNVVPEEEAARIVGAKTERPLKLMTNGEAGYGWLRRREWANHHVVQMLEVCSNKEKFRALTRKAFPELTVMTISRKTTEKELACIVETMRQPGTHWILKPAVGFCAMGVMHWGALEQGEPVSEEAFSVSGLRSAFDEVFDRSVQETVNDAANKTSMSPPGDASPPSQARLLRKRTTINEESLKSLRRYNLVEDMVPFQAEASTCFAGLGCALRDCSMRAMLPWVRQRSTPPSVPAKESSSARSSAISQSAAPPLRAKKKHETLLVETYLTGEQYTADGYFNQEGQVQILTVSHAPKNKADPGDIREIVLGTDLRILREQRPLAAEMMMKIQRAASMIEIGGSSAPPFFRNFPFMVEYRVDPQSGAALPIEVNALRHEGKSPAYATLIYTIPLYDFFYQSVPYSEDLLNKELVEQKLVAAMVFARKPNQGVHVEDMDFAAWDLEMRNIQAPCRSHERKGLRHQATAFPQGDNYFFGWFRGWFEEWASLMSVLEPGWELQFLKERRMAVAGGA